MLKAIRNPDIYHGRRMKSNFFEGWYFKIVDPKKEFTYCFIPGIFFSEKEEYSHSFIQLIMGHENNFKYLRYSRDDFWASKSDFQLKVGESSFSLEGIKMNVNQQNEKVTGSLKFINITKWPDSLLNPGSMGFYNYLTFMQCYSQVCAIDGYIEGSLNVNGKEIDFTGGKVYIEKNWGKDFPYSYIWVQGNHFDGEEGAVTCSIGHIPFLSTSFTGFLIGLLFKNKFYKFTSINRSKLLIECQNDKLILETCNKEYRLKIEALYDMSKFMNLYAPRDDKMIPIASETLNGHLRVELFERITNRLVFNDCCSSAGIEFSGNHKELGQKIR